jgi:hypothetical protein
MARHSKPRGTFDQARLLKALGEARRELIEAGRYMDTGSVLKASVDCVHRNIDELAGYLTGDKTYFWLSPQGSPSSRGSPPEIP